MKILCTWLGLLWVVCCFAQKNDKPFLMATMTAFHQAMVRGDTLLLKQHADKALSYGHSNGWVQTKKDLVNDLTNGTISYQQFDEDSVTVTMNENIANVRFLADIAATMKEKSFTFHLKVLEVWVKGGREWMLFARQAVKG